jgi:RNA polymerase sigma factor (sigma-70 family)
MSSPSPGSVTTWLGRLKAGDHAAAQELWERYFQRLIRLADQILPQPLRGAADHEDAALSALASFIRCAQAGRFRKLHDRDDLWQMLVVLTARKVHHQIRDETAGKRGGGHVETRSFGAEDEESAVEQILSHDPTPEFAVQVAEEYQRLLTFLGDDVLRNVAIWKMEGDTNDDIAKRLGRTTRSVERKLQMIRRKLQQMAEE